MIISFGNQGTEDIYHGLPTPKARRLLPQSLIKIAVRKLDILEAAHKINDLKVPPGNRLEALKGNFKGYYSIRVNDQFRIIFQWTEMGAKNVEIIDYH